MSHTTFRICPIIHLGQHRLTHLRVACKAVAQKALVVGRYVVAGHVERLVEEFKVGDGVTDGYRDLSRVLLLSRLPPASQIDSVGCSQVGR